MSQEDQSGDLKPETTLEASPRRMLAIPPAGAFCDHRKMRECHSGCGHFSCPCGVSWDEGAEGPGKWYW